MQQRVVLLAFLLLMMGGSPPPAQTQGGVVVCFVQEYEPTWGGGGTTVTINYRAALIGNGVPGNEMKFEAYFDFTPTGANPINQLEGALVDSLVAEAALLGVTLSRTATFIPTYKRGN